MEWTSLWQASQPNALCASCCSCAKSRQGYSDSVRAALTNTPKSQQFFFLLVSHWRKDRAFYILNLYTAVVRSKNINTYLFQLCLWVDRYLAHFTVKGLAGHTHNCSGLAAHTLLNSAGGPEHWCELDLALWLAAVSTIKHLFVLRAWSFK